MKITAEKVLFNKVVRGSSPRRPTTFTNDFSKLSGVTQISQPPKPCVQLRINNKIAYKLRTNRKERMGDFTWRVSDCEEVVRAEIRKLKL